MKNCINERGLIVWAKGPKSMEEAIALALDQAKAQERERVVNDIIYFIEGFKGANDVMDVALNLIIEDAKKRIVV